MHRRRHTRRTNKGHATAAAAAAADPFGPDGFGDSWNKSTKASFDSDSNEEEPRWQEEFHGPDCNWGKSLLAACQAEAKHKQDERLSKIEAALAASKERMKKEADEEAAAKAAAVAAAAAVVEAEAAAKKRWNSEVERAKETLARAKPAQALDIFYSLFADESFDGIIDFEEQANIAQMAAALEIHHELQKSLSLVWCVIDCGNGATAPHHGASLHAILLCAIFYSCKSLI